MRVVCIFFFSLYFSHCLYYYFFFFFFIFISLQSLFCFWRYIMFGAVEAFLAIDLLDKRSKQFKVYIDTIDTSTHNTYPKKSCCLLLFIVIFFLLLYYLIFSIVLVGVLPLSIPFTVWSSLMLVVFWRTINDVCVACCLYLCLFFLKKFCSANI